MKIRACVGNSIFPYIIREIMYWYVKFNIPKFPIHNQKKVSLIKKKFLWFKQICELL